MKIPARTSGFAISDILELNDAKPSQEEPDVQGYYHKIIILIKHNFKKTFNIILIKHN